MSRLNDLIRRVSTTNEALAADLQREVSALADRRSFGLNFERHVPEAVELPGRPVRKGDKVRCLPPRGETPKRENDRLFRVTRTYVDDADKWADIEVLDDTDEGWSVVVDDLVVVAEFRDPIYPGMVSTGKVERGGDKPFHTVINAENYYALEALLFTHRGKVDCIYIDPPYNTGAKDWKYNNDYVEGDDIYRHSKWLAFMERRLLLAKELLHPDASVLVVTIDEKEYLRLGLLLEQIFDDADIQMVSSVILPSGSSRSGRLSRADEYIFFVMLGEIEVLPWVSDMLRDQSEESQSRVRWNGLIRNGEGSRRERIPSMFWPIFLERESGQFHSVGAPLLRGTDRGSVSVPLGTVAVWPVDGNGVELMWRLSPETFEAYRQLGYIRFSRRDNLTGQRSPQYLQRGTIEKLEEGAIEILGRDPDGALELRYKEGRKTYAPLTVWNRVSHSAAEHGSSIVKSLLPGRRFPYPKSLYAVEDSVRFFVSSKPDALIVDFFAGSGTTAHAVMRLNKQDGGRRQSISVTNNEVSAEEQKALRENGLRPGDPEWEERGICDFITKPRIAAAITGLTPLGESIKGDYKFTDEFPLADGFEENVEFFTLTYESPLRVASNRDFGRIAPLLWMRAGSQGRRIDDISTGWDVADRYGVIANLDAVDPFLDELKRHSDVGMVFVVTNDDRLFESVVRSLPSHVEPVRLYASYLRNFEIEAGRNMR